MTKLESEVAVIIRSVGERTEAACYNLLARQIAVENITIIKESPFTAAIAKSFQVGLEQDHPWTLVIDADVLVHPEAVGQMLLLASQAETNTFEIQGNVLDKFFCLVRPAGNHLYRTSLLSEAIKHIPPDEVSLRPETFLMKQMADQGYPWIQQEMVVGLHDYEQFYSDIYRKSFVQAHKHSRHIPYLAALWKRLATEDTDYEVALKGLYAGLDFEGVIIIDADFLSQADLLNALFSQGLTEKGCLPNSIDVEVKPLIDSHKLPPEYPIYQRFNQASPALLWRTKLKIMARQIGWLRTGLWASKKAWRRILKGN